MLQCAGDRVAERLKEMRHHNTGAVLILFITLTSCCRGGPSACCFEIEASRKRCFGDLGSARNMSRPCFAFLVWS